MATTVQKHGKKNKRSGARSAPENAQEPVVKKSPAEMAAELRRKKIRKIKLYVGGGFAFLIFLIWFALQPLVAGMPYGVCRTYLETYVKYPNSLRIIQYDAFGKSLRIFFTYLDGFGNNRSEMIECIVANDSAGNIFMEKISIDRVPISDEDLLRFNQSIPGIVLYKPDLVIPPPYKGIYEPPKDDKDKKKGR